MKARQSLSPEEAIMPNRMLQDEIFAGSEADRWFERNKPLIETFDPTRDFFIKLVEDYALKPKRIIELGASMGARIAYLSRRFNASAVVIEPSEAAIRHGKKVFPHVTYHQGTLANYPFLEVPEKSFDLAIVSFVLLWVDRKSLQASIEGVDRAIQPGGFLLLGDFLPRKPHRVPYHHLPGAGVYTYKENYAERFIEDKGYIPLALLTGSHSAAAQRLKLPLDPFAPEHDRMGFWLLRKMG